MTSSHLTELTLENLHELDNGRIAEAFRLALKRVQHDCTDRPALAKARTVVLKLNAIPHADDEGDLQTVKITFDVKETIPQRSTRSYEMSAQRGAFLFNRHAPENPNQRTIHDYKVAAAGEDS